ncbi:conserved exported hypothetical protein [uncultured Desulfovibrio sp.]|uniref:Uncharacterized protein n=1 Tax=uncultured Desulfovibrio sp. TaxID=167968 RepID=A0A212L634_9BACT|nr:conserved exported hypothetical protein [uncultured Desulfovibrio sp.]
MFFCAALTAAVMAFCALPPTLVVGGLALEARAAVPHTASPSPAASQTGSLPGNQGSGQQKSQTTAQPKSQQEAQREAPAASREASQPTSQTGDLLHTRPKAQMDGQKIRQPTDADASASPLSGSVPDLAAMPDADIPPLADIERSEFARARLPMSSGAARILAEGNARQTALEAAADALPNRRDIRMGADSAEERLALAAQLYTPVTRHHKNADGAPVVTVLLRPRSEAAARITRSLRSFDLMQVRSALLGETAALLRLMNAHDPAYAGAARVQAAGTGKGPDAPLRGSGNLGTAYRAPVGMHDAAGAGSGVARGGDAHKNALDEIFSGSAGTGAGSQPALPAASDEAASAPHALPVTSDETAPSLPPLPSLDDAVWTERHWEAASGRLQALLRAQDIMEADAEGWLVPDGVLPRLERAAARLPQSPALWLLLAEAQLRRGLPLQSVASCDAALALAPGLNRARYIRALGHWRLQQLALAEDDLTSSLDARHGLAPQGEDRARRLRARGAVRMQRRDLTGMCEDFGAACALGECEGLILSRARGYCLPAAPAGTGVGAEPRQHDEPSTPERENTGQRGAGNSPATPLGALGSPGPDGPQGPDMPDMPGMPDGGGGARP